MNTSSAESGINVGKKEREPILFLFIDDIDLKMIRSRELMEAILQYTNHPNVVTILSGDFDILLESITLALLQDEKLPLSNLDSNFRANERESIKERKQRLAHEYIKKIIPPARRHQLLQWNENTIPHFAFGDLTLISQLNKLFISKNLFGYRLDSSPALHPIVKSFSIFDRTPRGIVNVYYHIHEMNERYSDLWRADIELDEREKRERFTIVKSLVDTILLSSTQMAAVQRDILEKFIVWGQDSKNTFLDYSKVEAIADKEVTDIILKEIQDGKISSKQENSLLFPLLIIGEMIQSLLSDVRFNETECRSQQLKGLREILQLNHDSNSKESRLNRYGRIVNEFFFYISFQNSLVLTDLLLDKKEWLVHPYKKEDRFTAWTEQLDRWLLTQINQLITKGKEEKLLSNLYYHQYVRSKQLDSSLKDAQLILNFLTQASESNGEYVYYKSLYEYPMTNGPWGRMQTLLVSSRFAEELFLHLIVEVNKWNDIKFNEELLALQERNNSLDRSRNKKNAARQLRGILSSVIKKQQMNEEVTYTPAQKNRVDKLIVLFYEALFARLREKLSIMQLFVEWKEEDVVNKAIKYFKNSGQDGTSETNYKKTKNKLEDTINKQETYQQYNERRFLVKKLADNYSVWYGRQEAATLLQILSREAYMAPSNLEPDELWVLRHLDVYLKQVNEAAIIDENYERIKEEMRRKLKDGFIEAMELVTMDLNDFGMNLDEDEELNEDVQ
ncbi:hypothetical protein [Paenibacillus sp. ATY16]|uniref:hypothetical protein n=1 Tax=Paenibacillus sp. ATY16 TaxID=1759312 RepID=UPI00200DBE12|nr:hypothetical protein [Paenibacillus sp. ATY16]MCK9860482.1 hypothetical protein [Paenibacillus sp. ATY16]